MTNWTQVWNIGLAVYLANIALKVTGALLVWVLS